MYMVCGTSDICVRESRVRVVCERLSAELSSSPGGYARGCGARDRCLLSRVGEFVESAGFHHSGVLVRCVAVGGDQRGRTRITRRNLVAVSNRNRIAICIVHGIVATHRTMLDHDP